MNNKARPLIFLLTACGFCGFAVAANNRPASNQTVSNTEQATPVAVTDKAAKKISKAIGEEIEDFVVTAQDQVDAPTGYRGTQYTVMTNGGKKFKCEILEPSRLGKIATLGMGSGADATCTEFANAGPGKGKPAASQANSGAGGKPQKKPAVAAAAGKPEPTTPVAVSDKAAKKISKAIGEEIDGFVVTAQEAVDAPTGYKGTQYTVMTNGGKKFKCEILEPSKLGRVATLGMGSGADAMCTDFTKGSQDKGKTNAASCNALLRAAKKC